MDQDQLACVSTSSANDIYCSDGIFVSCSLDVALLRSCCSLRIQQQYVAWLAHWHFFRLGLDSVWTVDWTDVRSSQNKQ
uniref:Uncharacterized protein n=1 Tax=Rhizophora mucronata TaxID=61149 RepID=A0A2P2K9A4_RHIMU